MNNLKTTILILGLIVMIAIGIYPPWVHQNSDGKQTPMGYSFIWSPPAQKVEKNANIFGFKIDMELGEIKANSIDVWKLLIQEAIAAGITFGAATVAGSAGKQKAD